MREVIEHLLRDFETPRYSPDGQARRLGCELLRPTSKLFAALAAYRDGTLS